MSTEVTPVITDAVQIDTPNLVPVATDDEATTLIKKAIDKKVDVGTMERLLAMRDKLRAEKAKEAFDRAMASFQSACPVIEKRKQGYNYKYAPLESIVEQVRDLLSKNGFSYTFDTEEAEKAVVSVCKVKHIAGHTEISKTRIPIDIENRSKMNASQQSGSAITYGKRYAFLNAFGILTGDEDTDASTRSAGPQKPLYETAREHPELYKQPEDQPKETADYPITDKQILFIKGLLQRKGYLLSHLYSKYAVDSMDSLTGKQASEIIRNLLKLKDNPLPKMPVTEKQYDDAPSEEMDFDAIDEGIAAQRVEDDQV